MSVTTPPIHPSSILAGNISMDESVQIGPGCSLEGDITLAAGVRLIGNVYLRGPLRVGPRTVFYPFSCVGFDAQDAKFKPGMPTAGVQIGADCTLREHTTVHAATKADIPTVVGDRVYMMVASHVGHDVRVEDDVTMVNNAVVGGHAHIGQRAILSGNTAVHQFCRVGRLAMVSGDSALSNDLPPFLIIAGRNVLAGLNLVGMRRSGMSNIDITAVREAYRTVFRMSLTRPQMLEHLAVIAERSPAVKEMYDFVKEAKRPISIRPSARGRGDEDEPGL